MSYYQYSLKTKSGFDNIYLTTWIDYERKLKSGEKITLKDYRFDSVWTVISASSESREAPPDKSWKVGGLV